MLEKDKTKQYIRKNGIQLNIVSDQGIKGRVFAVDNKGQTFYNDSNLVYQYNTDNGKIENDNNRFQFIPDGSNKNKL